MSSPRDEAVRVVDAHHGFTVEFSNTPEMHAKEYDEAERVLRGGGVVCPDCDRGVIAPHDRCSHCSLSWEDLEAAAAFFDALTASRSRRRR